MHGSRWRAYADGCLPDPRELKAHVTKRELRAALEVCERTIERMVERDELPDPVLVKLRAKHALEVRYMLHAMPGWVKRKIHSYRRRKS